MQGKWRRLGKSKAGRPNLDYGIKEGLSEEVTVKLDLKIT